VLLPALDRTTADRLAPLCPPDGQSFWLGPYGRASLAQRCSRAGVFDFQRKSVHDRDERPVTPFQRACGSCSAIPLSAQIAWRVVQAPAAPRALTAAAAERAALRLASFGLKRNATARLMMLYLQAFDYSGSNANSYGRLDYARSSAGYSVLELDPAANIRFSPPLASDAENPDRRAAGLHSSSSIEVFSPIPTIAGLGSRTPPSLPSMAARSRACRQSRSHRPLYKIPDCLCGQSNGDFHPGDMNSSRRRGFCSAACWKAAPSTTRRGAFPAPAAWKSCSARPALNLVEDLTICRVFDDLLPVLI